MPEIVAGFSQSQLLVSDAPGTHGVQAHSAPVYEPSGAFMAC
jgi:hypothetical protein